MRIGFMRAPISHLPHILRSDQGAWRWQLMQLLYKTLVFLGDVWHHFYYLHHKLKRNTVQIAQFQCLTIMMLPFHERKFGAKLKKTENCFFFSHKMWNNQPLPSPKIHSKEKMSRTNVEVEHLSILENWAWSENICFEIEHESEKSTWCLFWGWRKGRKNRKRERERSSESALKVIHTNVIICLLLFFARWSNIEMYYSHENIMETMKSEIISCENKEH